LVGRTNKRAFSNLNDLPKTPDFSREFIELVSHAVQHGKAKLLVDDMHGSLNVVAPPGGGSTLLSYILVHVLVRDCCASDCTMCARSARGFHEISGMRRLGGKNESHTEGLEGVDVPLDVEPRASYLNLLAVPECVLRRRL